MGRVVVNLQSINSDKKTGFPEDISYWLNLWDNYISECKEVIIHCWNEETEELAELQSRDSYSKKEGLITSFALSFTDDNKKFLRNHSVDPKGGLKWFTMLFRVEGEERLEIEYYGSEIVIYKLGEDEAEKFTLLFPSTANTQFHEDDTD